MFADHFDFTVPLLATIHDVYTPDECRALIALVADGPWLAATVNAARGRVVNERLRNNDTAIVRDEALADALLARVRGALPPVITLARRAMALAGLYRPLRVYRYRPGQQFGLHHDQSYAGPDGTRSLLTLLVYLDDDCDGGETDFPEQGRRIIPRAGEALWFQHMLLHAGLPVTRGEKHVLRADVLYG